MPNSRIPARAQPTNRRNEKKSSYLRKVLEIGFALLENGDPMYFANWASSMAGKKKSTEARPFSRGGPKRGKKKIDFWTIETKKNEDDGYVLEKMRFVEKENEERGEWVGLGRPANGKKGRKWDPFRRQFRDIVIVCTYEDHKV
jgi:hypothetical protein